MAHIIDTAKADHQNIRGLVHTQLFLPDQRAGEFKEDLITPRRVFQRIPECDTGLLLTTSNGVWKGNAGRAIIFLVGPIIRPTLSS